MNLYRLNYYLPGWTNITTFHDGRSWEKRAKFRFEPTGCIRSGRPVNFDEEKQRKSSTTDATWGQLTFACHCSYHHVPLFTPPASQTRDGRKDGSTEGAAAAHGHSADVVFFPSFWLSLKCLDDYNCQIKAPCRRNLSHVFISCLGGERMCHQAGSAPNLSLLFPASSTQLRLQPSRCDLPPSNVCKTVAFLNICCAPCRH